MNKFAIFFIIFLAYSFYKLFDFFDFAKSTKEIGMTKCSQLSLWNECIQSQIQYKNFIIISACNKCDCQNNGASFHQFEIATNLVKPIKINSNIDQNFLGISMNVFDNYLFIVNNFNNTVIVYEIHLENQQIALTYFYNIPVDKNHKLTSILALSPYEMIATAQNLTSIYQGENEYYKQFYDFLSYFGIYTQSFVLYMRNDIYDKFNDIKVVKGTEASKLSGIAIDKQYRVFIGRPFEKAIGVYKYKGYKNWGVELTLQNITYVNFPVQEIQYSKSQNELILAGATKLYLKDTCHGQLSSLKLSMNMTEFQLGETFQTNKKICGMSTAIKENSIYYIGSKTSQQFVKCEQ